MMTIALEMRLIRATFCTGAKCSGLYLPLCKLIGHYVAPVQIDGSRLAAFRASNGQRNMVIASELEKKLTDLSGVPGISESL